MSFRPRPNDNFLVATGAQTTLCREERDRERERDIIEGRGYRDYVDLMVLASAVSAGPMRSAHVTNGEIELRRKPASHLRLHFESGRSSETRLTSNAVRYFRLSLCAA